MINHSRFDGAASATAARPSSRPFVFTPASAGAIKTLPADERGLASSLVGEARQIGAVFGVAALGSIIATFELSGRTGASSAGLQAALVTAAAVSLIPAIVVRVTFSTGVQRPPSWRRRNEVAPRIQQLNPRDRRRGYELK
jgi:hypothetical protein